MSARHPIGVFDSGVGGLSVLIELQKLMPRESFIFLADQTHVPYGEKSPDELRKLTHNICGFLVKNRAKLIVVACNTATCYAIDFLRSEFEVPFVGTVPAVKPAVGKTTRKLIGIISTPATSKSDSLSKLIAEHAKKVQVINIGCAGLENAVEKGDVHSKEVHRLLIRYLRPIKQAEADAIVLGCTHYPFLKAFIRKYLGPNVRILDSGRAVARRTASLLGNSSHSRSRASNTLYFTTGDSGDFSRVASVLMRKKIVAQHVSI